MNETPLFFEQMEALINLIPKQADPQFSHVLIDNYLQHYSLTLNSLPKQTTHEIWQSRIADFRIVEQRWKPQQSNGQRLYLCHGYFDHTALYGRIIRWALTKGYELHSFDLPGHGLSGGRAAAIQSFDQYSTVLNTIIEREAHTTFCLLGQSTGCAVAVNSCLSTSLEPLLSHKPQQLILLAPLVRSHYWQYLRWIHIALNPLIDSIKRGFIDSSHDKEFNDFLHYRDPLQSKQLPLCWLGAMDEWIDTIKELKAEAIPSFTIQGTEDNTVDYEYNLDQLKRVLPAMTVEYIDGAYHHLVNESETYWQTISSALDKI